jgi:hydroxyacylglutathione hydrolase
MATIIPVRAFSDNYVWIVRDGGLAAVVDPGDAAPVLDYVENEGLSICAILATHHHRDHVGGVAAIVERFDAPVFGPARESIPSLTRGVAEDDRVDVRCVDEPFHVLDIPGHTAGHIAFSGRVGEARVVFCGDTLFAAGCGKLFEGTPQQMWTSLSKLAALSPETLVYCGHEYTLANLRFAAAVEPGNPAIARRVQREQFKRDRGEPTVPSTIGEELETNPFLRAAQPAVRAAAEAQAGRSLARDVDVFATLRAWKNGFAG